MIKINEILKKYNLKAKKIKKIGKATIVDTQTEKIVIKKSHIDDKILTYLKSRNFDYFPTIIENKDYNITKYIEDYKIPNEQRMEDLVKLISLLHNKTTHYKNIDIEKNEKIYRQLIDNINYLYSSYTDRITLIESKVFMSPSDLLFSANITHLYNTLDNSKKKLEQWYNLIKNKDKERNVIIHNNLKLDHFIRNKKSYLINWDKSKIDSPVFDLYKLHINEPAFNFNEILKEYEKNYPLLEDEKILLELLIEIPEDISFTGTEYEKIIKINNILERKTISPETSEQRKEQENKK